MNKYNISITFKDGSFVMVDAKYEPSFFNPFVTIQCTDGRVISYQDKDVKMVVSTPIEVKSDNQKN